MLWLCSWEKINSAEYQGLVSWLEDNIAYNKLKKPVSSDTLYNTGFLGTRSKVIILLNQMLKDIVAHFVLRLRSLEKTVWLRSASQSKRPRNWCSYVRLPIEQLFKWFVSSISILVSGQINACEVCVSVNTKIIALKFNFRTMIRWIISLLDVYMKV